jgi:hypothetical protein
MGENDQEGGSVPITSFIEITRALGGVEASLRAFRVEISTRLSNLDDRLFDGEQSHEVRLRFVENLYQRYRGARALSYALMFFIGLLFAKWGEILKALKWISGSS